MRRGRQLRTGALALLSVCFVASALLRAGDVWADLSAESLAREMTDRRAGLEEAATAHAERLAPEIVAGTRALREIEKREAALSAREAAVDARLKALEAAERRIALRFEQLKAARAELEEAVEGARGASARDVRHLAETYARMKPREAGALFNAMEPAFAAGFLAEMTPDAAAAVMASMDTTRAYAVSVLLASRNVAVSAEREGRGDSRAGEAGR